MGQFPWVERYEDCTSFHEMGQAPAASVVHPGLTDLLNTHRSYQVDRLARTENRKVGGSSLPLATQERFSFSGSPA